MCLLSPSEPEIIVYRNQYHASFNDGRPTETDNRKYAHTEASKNSTNYNRIGPSPYSFIINICVVYMNVFAGFDAIPSITLQDIKEI